MKISSATSAKATGHPPRTGRSSGRQPSPISADVVVLTGPSDLPDPHFHAFRNDLADVALAGRVIVSHYAEPVKRSLSKAAAFRSAPSDDSELIRELSAGEPFHLLDDSVGWAWGYAGSDRRVGYLRSKALARHS
ncbi:MAG: hypothetical protein M3448_03335 [Pseudomonadota bacterium]|nr:hypothetical protein [Pseudomonadota bacterium]